MLSRIVIICITGFWLAMTGLLVVRELYPESLRLNEVSLAYVGQIVFQHEQASDLRISTSDKSDKDSGFLHIQPRNVASTGQHALELHGSVSFTLPGGSRQRLVWIGAFEMSRDFSPARLHLDLSTAESGQHTDVVVDFAGKKAVFGVKMGEHIVNETAFTLDEAGFGKLTAGAGVDPMLMRQLAASQSGIPRFDFSAQSSSLVISGQKLETFLLSVKAGGQDIFSAHLSQLGQVLSAQAPALGWKLTPLNLAR